MVTHGGSIFQEDTFRGALFDFVSASAERLIVLAADSRDIIKADKPLESACTNSPFEGG